MRNRLHSALYFILFALFVAFSTPKVLHLLKLQQRNDRMETQIRALQKENKALEKELFQLQHDPVYLEKVARNKFKVAKEGEIVYKVVREGDPKRN